MSMYSEPQLLIRKVVFKRGARAERRAFGTYAGISPTAAPLYNQKEVVSIICIFTVALARRWTHSGGLPRRWNVLNTTSTR